MNRQDVQPNVDEQRYGCTILGNYTTSIRLKFEIKSAVRLQIECLQHSGKAHSMQLERQFNAIDNAILIVKPFGDYRRHVPYLKIVAGTKEEWTEKIFPQYGGTDTYVAVECESKWTQLHGKVPENWFNVNWAEYMLADSIPYDGIKPLTRPEREAVSDLSQCDLTLDILWAAIEGMGWRPTSSKEPLQEQIREFYLQWRSDNSEPPDATRLALMLTLYDRESGLAASEAKAEKMMMAALSDLPGFEQIEWRSMRATGRI